MNNLADEKDGKQDGRVPELPDALTTKWRDSVDARRIALRDKGGIDDETAMMIAPMIEGVAALSALEEARERINKGYPHDPHCNYWTQPMGCPGCSCAMYTRAKKAESEVSRLLLNQENALKALSQIEGSYWVREAIAALTDRRTSISQA